MRDILTLSSSRDGHPQQWNFGGMQPVNEMPQTKWRTSPPTCITVNAGREPGKVSACAQTNEEKG